MPWGGAAVTVPSHRLLPGGSISSSRGFQLLSSPRGQEERPGERRSGWEGERMGVLRLARRVLVWLDNSGPFAGHDEAVNLGLYHHRANC